MTATRSIVLLFPLLLSGCPAETAPPSASGATLTQVSLQLNWLPEPQFGGSHTAKALGIFEKRGLDVTIRKGGPDIPAVQMAASGKVEFALAAADEVIRIREGGADVVAVWATYQTAPQGIMTHAARGVGSFKELFAAGGTLAVQPGLAYVEFLKKQHDTSAMKLVTYQGGIGQFLATKDSKDFAQQCFVTSEPLAAKREGVEPKVFLIAESGFNPYTSVVITRREYLEKNRAVVKSLVEALEVGWRSYLDDPGPANAVMRKLNPSMDAETFQAAAAAQKPLIETETTKTAGLGSMTLERWTQLNDQLKALGTVEGTVDPADCFVTLR
jgi:NitT/TauT family transport system substrate-binding protein